jgi:hypothetical protein
MESREELLNANTYSCIHTFTGRIPRFDIRGCSYARHGHRSVVIIDIITNLPTVHASQLSALTSSLFSSPADEIGAPDRTPSALRSPPGSFVRRVSVPVEVEGRLATLAVLALCFQLLPVILLLLSS